MKKMKVVLASALVLLLSGMSLDSNAQFFKFRKKKAKTEAKADSAKKTNKAEEAYNKLLKDAETIDGLFKVHKVKEKDDIKYYFEIPKTLLDKDLLFSSRVSTVSTNFNVSAGYMPSSPFMFSFKADEFKVYLTFENYNVKCDKDSEIYPAYERNYTDCIWKAYKIKAYSKDSSSLVIDMSDMFVSSEKRLAPFVKSDGMAMMGINFTGSVDKGRSKILDIKSFPKNVRVKSRLAYTILGMPYTVEMTRNIVVLPDEPMMPRYSDERVGYFEQSLYEYKTYKAQQAHKLITKWNIKPAPEDVDKYKKGELVEPINPIVWYVDPAIPAKWRKYVKAGIEDWQEAFEEIGFKNAIIAKDYPTKEEDPNFDPDDIRYTCYRYITTSTKNSMGPSWVDPRSGEIICGDVYFYSNVVDLIQEWRFIQTAQIDEAVRKPEMDIDIIGESLRYVAAHEVGHTLGLMHNFLSSAAYPVEKLRDADFTQKYGTTPSIMDYARYNYVAQPGDKGVKLIPPKLGVYDKFAIKFGYKPIFDVQNPEDEYNTLNSWILEHKDDPMYTYINPYTHRTLNPDCQTEAIGDDAVKASEYGIKNLKYITKHLPEWINQEGKDYKLFKKYYDAIYKQFVMYYSHVLTYMGGEYTYATVQGDGIKAHSFVGKKKQKEALNFVYNQLRDFSDWYYNEDITKHLKTPKMFEIKNQQGWLFSLLFSRPIASGIIKSTYSNQKDKYTYTEFQKDIYNKVWYKSRKGYRLSDFDLVIQTTYVNCLLKGRDAGKLKQNSNFLAENLNAYGYDQEYVNMVDKNNLVMLPYVENPEFASGTAEMLFKTYDLIKRLKNTGNARERAHYQALYLKLKLALEK